MLSPSQIAARENRLTASRVACLMTGDTDRIMRLWQEMVGDPAFEPEDLSSVWAVQLGAATEALNLAWYERKVERPLSRQGEVVVHPEVDWAAATLDGWDAHFPAPVEAKHVGGWEPLPKVIERYQPQLHWQMLVTGTTQAMLSVIEGAKEPVIEAVPLDAGYAAELWRRAEAFMECVWSLRPPVAMPGITAPVPPEKWRTVDLRPLAGDSADLPNWADDMRRELDLWKATAAYAKTNAKATKAVKELLPEDVGIVTWIGATVSRAKNNAVSIREDNR